MDTHVRLALFYRRIAVRVRNLGLLAKTGGDTAMDEAKHGNRSKGDGDDGTVVQCKRYYILHPIQAPL